MMRRVLFVTMWDLAETPYPLLCAKAFAGPDIELEVWGVCSHKAPPYKLEGLEHIRVKQLPRGARIKGILTLCRAMLVARIKRATAIVVFGMGAIVPAYVALRGPRGRTRIIYYSPDMYDPAVYRWRAFVERWLVRKADLFVSTEYHRAYIQCVLARRQKSAVIAPTSLPSSWCSEPDDEDAMDRFRRWCEGAYVFAVNTRYSSLRRGPEIAAALQYLPREYKCAFTGDPPTAANRDVEEGIAQGRIAFLGNVTFKNLIALTRFATGGLLLYDNNDIGNFFQSPGRLAQFLVCGKPVVASNFTGLAYLVRELDIGICVDGSRPESIAAGMREVVARCEAGYYSSEALKETFKRKLAWENWEGRLSEAFERVLRGENLLAGHAPVYPWL